ncbi:MAG: hypothetical protein WCF84_23840 [Anaerolineae bacterium]
MFNLQAQIKQLKSLLLDPYLIGALLLALLAIILAYQFRYPFSIQVGGPIDGPLLSHIHAPQIEKPIPTQRIPMRWTTGDSELLLSDWGAGNPLELQVSLSRWQPDNGIADLTLEVNGQEFDKPQAAGQGRQDYKLPITDPQFLQSNNLSVKFLSDTFNPSKTIPGSKDDRNLGIELYSIKLTPLQEVSGQWRAVDGLVWAPFKLPPLRTSLAFIGSALALYLGMVLFKIPRRLAFGVVAIATIAAAIGLVWVRPYLTLFAVPFFELLVLSILIGLFARLIVPRLLAWGGIRPVAWELDLLALLFAFAFLVKIVFLLYPQTISFDLLYHAHRLQWVMEGTLFWSIPSGANEFGGKDVPYLPSYYLFLAPFARFVNGELLVKLSGILLDNVTIGFIYFLVKKYFDDGRAGLFAAWIYIVVPLSFIAISWGIYANIYGQFLTLLLVVALVEAFDRLTTPRGFMVIALLFTLTLLSHTSVFASIVPMFAIWAILLLALDRAWGKKPYWAFIGSILIASVIAFFAYYAHFVGLMTAGTSQIVDAASTEATRNLGDKGLTFLDLLQPARTEFIAVPLYIYAAMVAGFGWLIYQARRTPTRERFLLLTMLAAWFAALGILMYTRAEFGFSSRYVNFAMPAIALCAGAAFSWVYAHGLVGRGLALGAAAFLGAQGAYHWFVLVMYKYH